MLQPSEEVKRFTVEIRRDTREFHRKNHIYVVVQYQDRSSFG